MDNNMKSHFRIFLLLIAMCFVLVQAAGVSALDDSAVTDLDDASGHGASISGEGDDFMEYLDDEFDDEERDFIELYRIDEDSKVQLGAEEDPGISLEMQY
jgi:hypothetical protein